MTKTIIIDAEAATQAKVIRLEEEIDRLRADRDALLQECRTLRFKADPVPWRDRAEAAEAERDALKRTLATYSEEDSWADLEAARARITQLEQRIDELEAVVRDAKDLLEGA